VIPLFLIGFFMVGIFGVPLGFWLTALIVVCLWIFFD
jgi:hypothetical protein